jgi:hypothetical protein
MSRERRSKRDSWAVVEAYAAERESIFAGAYIGGEGEPAIVTLWTENPAGHAEALTVQVRRVVGGKLAQWPLIHLESLAERAGDEMEQLRAEGIAVCGVGTAVMENCVDIGVTGLTEETRSYLSARYGPAANIFEEEIVAA